MKIPAAQIDNIIKSIWLKYRIALIYGPDYGQVMQRSDEIISYFFNGQKPDEFRYCDYSFDDIKSDYSAVTNDILGASFFGGQKLIRIKDFAASMPKDFESIIKSVRKDVFVIITAGDLATTSSLRKFFESYESAAAIACYKDDAIGTKKLIYGYFNKHGIRATDAAISLISENISGDRMMLYSELDKIIIFAGNRTNLDVEDIQDIIVSSNDYHADELVHSIFSGDKKTATKYYDSVISEFSEIGLLRFTMKYCYRLLDMLSAISSGSSPDKAVMEARPPVFFKHQKTVASHLSKVNIDKLLNIISTLSELELYFKSSMFTPVVFKNRIMNLV